MKKLKLKTIFRSIGVIPLLAALLSTLVFAGSANTVNVMAPLEVHNWWEFDNQLQTAKNMGVNAVSVDVWWGKVEGSYDQGFDWSYYDTIVSHIENAGLHWVPIMSFHKCGGNVGDTCNIPIPGWIWNKYPGTPANDMKYRSEQGNYSTETVSLWKDHLVISEYIEFMDAFESHFANKAYMTDEINISMGPAGELRYPSYNGHDNNSGYPTRGAFQSYSEPAKADFRNWALNKYGSLNGINNAWGFSLSNINQVNPPSNAYNFVQNADHFNMAYGRDFIRWYHEALRSHGIRMMDAAINAFDQSMKYKDLGFKIPGVHWQMGAGGGFYRSAEIAAGLIPTDVDLNANYTAHGYSSIISIADSFNWSSHEIVLHFTCLEMSNQNWHPQYSKAQDLVFWVASGASDQGVPIKGENALNGGVHSDTGWNNIENAFNWASYSGLTVLRINDVTNGGTGQYRMGNFIWNY